jgi:cytochrome b
MPVKSVDKVKVWDPLVRIFHWSLVAAIVSAYLSEHDWFAMHIWSGFTVTGLVAFRLLWGFIGTEHARFRGFIYGPRPVWGDLKALLAWHPNRYLGHGPSGGAMVIALLALLTAVILTGMQLYAVAEYSGPFVAIQDAVTGVFGEAAGSKYFLADLHGIVVNITLLFVFVHVSCVVLVSLALGENLPLAMITGKKRVKKSNDIVG